MFSRLLSIDCGMKNMALCRLRDTSVLNWEAFTIIPGPIGLREAMDARPWASDVEHVIVEHQVRKNPKMIATQHYLEMYFACKNIPVTIVSAKQKLGLENIKMKNTYRQRKKTAVLLTKEFLGMYQVPDPHVFFKSKKQDDLADCLLQGLKFNAMVTGSDAHNVKFSTNVV